MDEKTSDQVGPIQTKVRQDKSLAIVCICPTCGNTFDLPVNQSKKKQKPKTVDIRAMTIMLIVAAFIFFWVGVGIKVLVSHYRIVAVNPPAFVQQSASPSTTAESPSVLSTLSVGGKMVTIDRKIYLIGKIKNTGGVLVNKQMVVTFVDANGNTVDKKSIGFSKLAIGETPFEIHTEKRNAVKCRTELK